MAITRNPRMGPPAPRGLAAANMLASPPARQSASGFGNAPGSLARSGPASPRRKGKNRRLASGPMEIGLDGRRQTVAGLLDQKGDARMEAAKIKADEEMAGAQKGLAAAVGRSARNAGGGGRGDMLANAGRDLYKSAATSRASARLGKIEAQTEKEQFLADSYVSPEEAKNLVEDYIDGIEDEYSGVFGDDESGIANALTEYANRPGISDSQKRYALEQANKFRNYENNFWAKDGRSIGVV